MHLTNTHGRRGFLSALHGDRVLAEWMTWRTCFCYGQDLARCLHSLQNASQPWEQEGHLSSRVTGSVDTGRLWVGDILNHILKDPAGHPPRRDGYEGHHECKLATRPGQQSPSKDKELFLTFLRTKKPFQEAPPANRPSQLTGRTGMTLPSSDPSLIKKRDFLPWFLPFKIHSLAVIRSPSLGGDTRTNQGSLQGRKGWLDLW